MNKGSRTLELSLFRVFLLSPGRGMEVLVPDGRLQQSRQEGFVAASFIPQTCTGRTCLKWSPDGSLSEHDQDELMKRLCATDPALAQCEACNARQDADLSKINKR